MQTKESGMAAALEARDLTTTYGHVEPPAGAAVAWPSRPARAELGHAMTRALDIQTVRLRRP